MESLGYFRPTKAIINLQAIKHNIEQLKKRLLPDVQIIAVVKANAYGHGDVEVSKAAIEEGCSMLAVATPEEALHLRENFPDVDILILGHSPVRFAKIAADKNITLTVYSTDWVKLAENALPEGSQLKLHLKVDSGMGRIGVTTKETLLDLYNSIDSSNKMVFDGIFTHFATADEEDESYFTKQADKFVALLSVLPKKPRLIHAANTATAFVKDVKYQFNAVRFGISMYGLAPSDYVKSILPFSLEPAFSLETELIHVKRIEKGESVGYGKQFTATEPVYIGTLPIGYADGVIRKLQGQEVLVRGERVPIVGRICMDQCMILLPKAYNVGEKVILIGSQQDEHISIDEWAEKLETINYEIPCIITSRVPRIFIK